MKKIVVFVLAIAVLAAAAFSEGTFQVSVGGGFLLPRDAALKTSYGKALFFPCLQAAYEFGRTFFVWSDYGFSLANGKTAELGDPARLTQHVLSAGIGIAGTMLTPKLKYDIRLGLAYVHVREKAMDAAFSLSTTAMRLEAGLSYAFGTRLFSRIALSHFQSSDRFEGENLTVGGWQTKLAVGMRF